MSVAAPSPPEKPKKVHVEQPPALARVIWGNEGQGLSKLWNRERELVEPMVGNVVKVVMAAFALGAAHVARGGVISLRGVGASMLIVALVLGFTWVRFARRARTDAALALVRTLGAKDRELGEKGLRALSLLHETAKGEASGSSELAQLHFEKLVARASLVDVEESARRLGSRYRLLFWPLLLLAGALALGVNWSGKSLRFEPSRVLEGYNVLLARGGRAPVAMAWLERRVAPEVVIKPPLYLREPGNSVAFGEHTREPKGSEITVRGLPVRPGRTLVLTDGVRDEEFVDDGADAVVAHWPLEQSTTLYVAARFGDVRIYEPDALVVDVQPDTVPKVELQGAPQTLHLNELESVELRYRAVDDHGLRQIDLVLRSGGKEQRRTLARLDGHAKLENGGHALAPNDSFLKRLFLPVVITIEAKDNEPLSADRWGKSAAITLIPPALGAVQVARTEVLLGVRDALTEFLAWQLHAKKSDPRALVSQKERASALLADTARAFQQNANLTPGLEAFITTEVSKLTKLSEAELILGTETALLSVDMLARRLAADDARFVAKQLSEVAKEMASAAHQAQAPEGSGRSVARFDGAAGVLKEGGQQLRQLLELGHDLGTLTLSELDRILRARNREDFFHAELASRHLALRLSRPNPSFGSAASGGSEAGQGSQSSAQGDTSDADQKFDEWASQMERLAQEHAREIDSVERALKDADSRVDAEAFKKEAAERAQAIRELVEGLPEIGAAPETAEAAAALAREYAGAMAQNLERLSLENAVGSGRDALSSLKDTDRKRRVESYNYSLPDPEELRQTEGKLREHLAWAEKALEKLKEQSSAQARAQLSASANREKELGSWAEQLGRRGREKGQSVSEQSLQSLGKAGELMREAEQALEAGRGEAGRDLQLEAQKYLERASTGTTQAGEEEEKDAGSNAAPANGDVPKAERNRQAAEFRKRVLKGLGQANGGKLAPAVKRYAEGLLQ